MRLCQCLRLLFCSQYSFWSFLWDSQRALIGLPIMIAILTICEQHKSTEAIASLLLAGEKKVCLMIDDGMVCYLGALET